LALAHELLLEALRECKRAPVRSAETVLTHDSREQPRLPPPGVRGVELIGPLPVFRHGASASDAGVHQAREGREHVNRREDPAAVQLAAEHHLAFGDVAGEVGDGVGDVVVRHRKHGDLGGRLGPAW
jgi:hypothetical protein